MKKYKDKFKPYLKDLARRQPSPGGGSVTALSFCLGVSLIEKAINYSLPKVGATGQSPLQKGLVTLKRLKNKIYPYIDRDVVVFKKVMANQGLKRLKFIRQSEAIVVRICRAGQKAFLVAKLLKSGIKKGITSDFSIGLELIKLAFLGSIFNLEANARIFGRKNRQIWSFKRALRKWEQ